MAEEDLPLSAPAQHSSVHSSEPAAVLGCEEEKEQRKVGVWVGEKMWCKVVFDYSFAWYASLPSKIVPDIPARVACPSMTDVGSLAPQER